MNLRNPKRVNQGHKETKAFHNMAYGGNFYYPDFVPLFNYNFFDANQWADVFEQSGVKYLVHQILVLLNS